MSEWHNNSSSNSRLQGKALEKVKGKEGEGERRMKTASSDQIMFNTNGDE